MKCIILTKLASDFLIQGLGLSLPEGNDGGYTGKVGRHEVFLPTAEESFLMTGGEQVIYVGSAQAGKFRPGDFLMAGSGDLVDRAFQALDELELRGAVVNFATAAGSQEVILNDQSLPERSQNWREQTIPFLCLLAVEPFGPETTAQLVTLVRKVIN